MGPGRVSVGWVGREGSLCLTAASAGAATLHTPRLAAHPAPVNSLASTKKHATPATAARRRPPRLAAPTTPVDAMASNCHGFTMPHRCPTRQPDAACENRAPAISWRDRQHVQSLTNMRLFVIVQPGIWRLPWALWCIMIQQRSCRPGGRRGLRRAWERVVMGGLRGRVVSLPRLQGQRGDTGPRVAFRVVAVDALAFCNHGCARPLPHTPT